MSNLVPVNAKSFKINDEMVTSLDDAIKIGEIVAKSRMFPEVTDQAKAVVAILAGRELGIPPMASLRGIHVIKGKVEISAGLLAAMIKQSDKYRYEIRTPEAKEETECLLLWSENIGGAWTVVGHTKFTMADAKRAKLIKPDGNWEKFPRAMLFARALTEGQRKYCPEIAIGAAYAPGEIPTDDDVIESEPVKVDSAIRDVYDRIGELLTQAGLEDASGARRYWHDLFTRGSFQYFANEVRKPVKEIIAEFGHLAKYQPVLTLEETRSKPEPYLDEPMPSPHPVTIDVATTREILQAEAASKAVKYDQKNRNHNAQIGAEMDEAIKKLTILGVTAADLSQKVRETIEREVSGRKITTRYELNDTEAHAIVQFLNDRIDEKECEKAIAADEV